MIRQIKKSLIYKYRSLREGWHFPSDMTHTSGYQMVTQTYEPAITERIISVLSEKDLFWDVGANIGYFSKLASVEVGAQGLVVAFEADRENYKALVGNTKRRANVIPIHTAVSNRNGHIELSRSTHSCCHSTVDTKNYISGDTETVPAMNLDTLCAKYLNRRIINLLKIDVEGAEMDVLKGAEGVLSEGVVENMIIEYCPRIMLNAGFAVNPFFKLLSRYFRIQVLEETYKVTPHGTVSTLEDFRKLTCSLLSSEKAVQCNFFCTLNS